jgi:hypothetical protein
MLEFGHLHINGSPTDVADNGTGAKMAKPMKVM